MRGDGVTMPGVLVGGGATQDDVARAVFDRDVRPLMDDLFRYFVRRVPRDDAEDCLSETLLVLWRRWADVPKDAGGRRLWAYGVARKVAWAHQRKASRRKAIQDAVRAPLSSDPSGSDAVVEALGALSEADQELIRLIVWDGFGVGEAGRILGLKETTARNRWARAKAALRERLTDDADQAR